jgi:CheY-like chemotaxis protein
MAPAPDSSGLDATVLVVDDDDDFREALADALQDEGCNVLAAPSGEAALALLDEALKKRVTTPDLMVLDLVMPRMSGIEVLQRVRKSRHWRELPVLVVTAVNDQMLPIRLNVPIAFKPDAKAAIDAIRQQLARGRSRQK